MLTGGNRERLEQEIAFLISFISEGRSFFFEKTNFTAESSDNWLNHFVSKEIFQKHLELVQLELNIQLFYIKLHSYYKLTANSKASSLNKQRNIFAHELTDLVFNKRTNYNFFLHKVSENFKKLHFIFVNQEAGDDSPDSHTTLILELDQDIKNFLDTWKKANSIAE